MLFLNLDYGTSMMVQSKRIRIPDAKLWNVSENYEQCVMKRIMHVDKCKRKLCLASGNSAGYPLQILSALVFNFDSRPLIIINILPEYLKQHEFWGRKETLLEL